MDIAKLIGLILGLLINITVIYYIIMSAKTIKELQKEKRLVADRLDMVERKLNILINNQKENQ